MNVFNRKFYCHASGKFFNTLFVIQKESVSFGSFSTYRCFNNRICIINGKSKLGCFLFLCFISCSIFCNYRYYMIAINKVQIAQLYLYVRFPCRLDIFCNFYSVITHNRISKGVILCFIFPFRIRDFYCDHTVIVGYYLVLISRICFESIIGFKLNYRCCIVVCHFQRSCGWISAPVLCINRKSVLSIKI